MVKCLKQIESLFEEKIAILILLFFCKIKKNILIQYFYFLFLVQ